MGLKDRIHRGKKKSPFKIAVYGVEGVGKTTLAADAPDPLIISAEGGTDHIDCASFEPESWKDIMQGLRDLEDEGEFQTVVIDTADWIYADLLGPHVVREKGFQGGLDEQDYGRGHAAALPHWREFLRALESLRAKGKNVLLLAHAEIKSFHDPEGGEYDRYQLKMPKAAAGLVKEWPDALLFANYAVNVKKEKGGKSRGEILGRFLYTERTAAYDAKNRFSLPERLPLEWATLAAAMEEFSFEDELAKFAKFDGEKAEKLKKWVESAPDRRAAEATAMTRMKEAMHG